VKNLYVLALALVMLFTLSGCANNDTPDNSNTLPAKVQIDFAADELLVQYESFHEYNHEDEAAWLIIWTDTSVTDFEYIKVGYEVIDDNVVFFPEYVEHTIGELTPEKPFIVKTYGHYGTLPQYGISYTDANDLKRYFYIFESGKDGSLSFVEF
jgi:hypothetical protein